MRKILLFATSVLIFQTLIYAQHDDGHKSDSHEHSNKHHIAVFNGISTTEEHKEIYYTVGLDYEYRLSNPVGLGILGEFIFSEEKEMIGGLAVFVHPYKKLKIIAAPLLVYSKEHHDTGHESDTESENETKFSFRTGVAYDFHFGKLSVGPNINFDFGKVRAVSYGLSVGFGF